MYSELNDKNRLKQLGSPVKFIHQEEGSYSSGISSRQRMRSVSTKYLPFEAETPQDVREASRTVHSSLERRRTSVRKGAAGGFTLPQTRETSEERRRFQRPDTSHHTEGEGYVDESDIAQMMRKNKDVMRRILAKKKGNRYLMGDPLGRAMVP